ncbi:glycosyltransferase WbuB [Halomonas sp. DQ26W]|uniref:glycosyltransferase family 4 protein n=1 Tax=Halomonas sp. DQ26W TaxID=2282311 RepID=UPI000DF74D0F|nr:glycosyltransferase family 4 protein [Halomonas sp. DQ26W]RDB41810.1 glycosyltransferase WbuB [Halomonas sp. DQ26W]
MNIALVADTFPPLRTSGAVQLRDLSREFVKQGHSITVILPAKSMSHSFVMENMEGVQILRLGAPRTKDIGYVRRTLSEFMMPYFMLKNLRKSPLADIRWDGVVWYAPSIFFGPIVNVLKQKSGCRSYLIIRDIFPEWAVDMGLMRRGLPYFFFKSIANSQYSIADVIGIQTPGNSVYFEDLRKDNNRRLEVLHNWLADVKAGPCSIDLSKTSLAGRKIFVYAGNMGVAQGMDILLDLAERLRERTDIGFLFVGRGRNASELSADARNRNLDNVLFHDEIAPDEIPGLYAQCHIGLVALHPAHKTHNIPGKFLTYMQSGLPVLANINKGNDLIDLILGNQVGAVATDGNVDSLQSMAEAMVDQCGVDESLAARCRALYHSLFTPETAVEQIVNALQR